APLAQSKKNKNTAARMIFSITRISRPTDQAKWLHLGVLDGKILRPHCNLLADVVHDLVRFVFGHDTYSVVLADKDNLKGPLGHHPRKFSSTVGDRQSLFRVIPMELNRGIRALFVVIAVVFVLVEREITIRSAIDAQFNRIFRL